MENKDTEFEYLKSLVNNELVNKTERSDIVRALQKIGKYILQYCYFDFGDGRKIYPLWIEAYYYKENVFADPFVHGAKEQTGSDNFGKYYRHSDTKKTDKRNGVDICLSLGNDYYLSYLIKVSYDSNGVIYRQAELINSIKDTNDNKVLRIGKTNGRKVDNYYRIGLSSDHNMKKLFYQESLLSSYFDLSKLDSNSDNEYKIIKNTLNMIASLRKEDFVTNYLKRHCEIIENCSSKRDAVQRLSNQLIGYSIANTLFKGESFKEDALPVLYEEKLDLFDKKDIPNDNTGE